jgi:Spy/CpxP family protein refolding chaperone
MGEKKALRIWQWSVILLILCNAGLIATIWLKPAAQHARPGDEVRNYVIAQLKFSDGQVQQYDLLIGDHRHAMNELRREAMSYRADLFTLLKSNAPNDRAADSVSTLIAANQKQIELVTFHHFAQVRKLCTPQQQIQFDNIISTVMKKMGGPRQAPPPPRRDDRRGPPQDDENGPTPGDRRPPPDGGAPPPGSDEAQ